MILLTNCSSPKLSDFLCGMPLVLQFPRVSEEREPLSSHHGTISALSTGHLVDTNLHTSVLDTYRPPPAPIPYDTHVAHPHTPSQDLESSGSKSEPAVETTNTESAGETNSVSILDTKVKSSVTDEKAQLSIELKASEEVKNEDDLKKSTEPLVSSPQDEEDVCPICLEEYDVENPKLFTKCDHHFHLACILGWMERSDTCPVCDQETIFSPPIDV
ncbi:probable E3 ubiquitin- ligase RHB1A [Olea europaea subsp. europaea]|uniref:RING-type E3 ubiquitin transferase n=1 Tax=Olea europaea subsp. europaea TaxID=158383 RepID=A0A8S0PEY2_OLEEU|nr:probable E3 ubiquitin- ligase RHB1A [Olea europaea subsp. europaea]